MHHHKPRSKIAKALAFLLTIDVKRGHITSTARKFKISRRTLSNAWHKVQEVRQSHSLDSNDREVIRALHLTEPRGATSHRLLSDDQEALVVNKLRQDYPRGFNNAIIVNVCRNLFHDLRNHPRQYSKTFIKSFKKRSYITRSKIRIHQRTQADLATTFDADVEQACLYLEKVENLTSTIPPHLFINVDECPSYVRNLPTHGLHFVDSPPPWLFVRAKERDSVSTIGAVAGDGHVLNTAVIAKGTTTRCERKFHSQLPHSFIQHTSSGLTTSKSFVQYLEHVIAPYTRKQPAVLIVDAYKAHLTSKVRSWCDSHNIKLVVVPDRGTSTLQPLDVAVFGMAKLDIYHDVSNKVFSIDRDEADRWEATAECVKAIDRVRLAGGLRSWTDVFACWPEFLKKHKLV